MPNSPVGLALAGGGFLGAVYELATLAALGEAVDGLNLTELSVYVGVSAGAFVGAGLANGLTPHQMVRRFVESEDADVPIDPAQMLKIDWQGLQKSGLQFAESLPAVLATAVSLSDKNLAQRAWTIVERIVNQLPAGLIDSRPTQHVVRKLFSEPGRSDDFRQLKATLRIVATDIDSGAAVEFGSPGFDHVPISRAVRASSAVPGLFQPVKINGRRYVDGALNKTVHASVALQHGAKLVLCLNPLIPHETTAGGVGQNLPKILSQSVRTMIRSRMAVGVEKYRATHPDADVVLFEPQATDPLIFNSQIFSFRARRRLCEHVYQNTRRSLLQRAPELAPIMERHGLRLNTKVLADASLTLVRQTARVKHSQSSDMGRALDKLDATLEDLRRLLALQRATRFSP